MTEQEILDAEVAAWVATLDPPEVADLKHLLITLYRANINTTDLTLTEGFMLAAQQGFVPQSGILDKFERVLH